MTRRIPTVTGLPLLTLLASCAGGFGGEAGGVPAAAVDTGRPATAAGSGGSRGTALGAQVFDLAAGSGTALVVDVPAAGTLTATASWGTHGSDIDLYLTDSACSGLDDLVLGACNVLARGDSPTGKSETATAGVEPGRYQAFVLALAERGDSGSVEFSLAP